MLNKIKEEIITFDVDWAPEEAIQYSIDLVLESNSKATFFATHPSKVLKKYLDSDQIEVGIHPNYYKSTNFEQLIDELLNHYPEATSVRAHGLYSSSNIVKLYEKKGFKCCLDVFLPGHENLQPVWRFGVGSILLIPYFWEDGNHFTYKPKIDFNSCTNSVYDGMRIFNFHPIHVYANTESSEHYQAIRPYNQDSDQVLKRRGDSGIKDVLELLLKKYNPKNRIKDIYEIATASRT